MTWGALIVHDGYVVASSGGWETKAEANAWIRGHLAAHLIGEEEWTPAIEKGTDGNASDLVAYLAVPIDEYQ